MSYLKNKAKQLKVFTPEFNVALVINTMFIVGTYIYLLPLPLAMLIIIHQFLVSLS